MDFPTCELSTGKIFLFKTNRDLASRDFKFNLAYIFPVESSQVGKSIIDFKLPNKNGELIDTNIYRGSILLIDFWASWCAPCRKQLPEILKLYEKYKHKNFKILSVSLDKSTEKWVSALEKEQMIWDNVIESKEFNSEIVKSYDVNAIPSTFLIDEKGKIIANNPSFQNLENYLINLK